MTDENPRYDVVVVGAGTSGAAAALLLAQRGMRVCCLERGPLVQAGASWVNEVPGWMFDTAGIPRPHGEELLSGSGVSHLVAGWGPEPRLKMASPDGLSVDMRLLVARLQRMAGEAGAEFRPEVAAEGCEGGRLFSSAGIFKADWIVDASGLAGRRAFSRPGVRPLDLCAAAQAQYQVADPTRATEFFAQRGVLPGQNLCYTGVAGGFSVVNLRLHGDSLGILTGSIPAMGAEPGKSLLQGFVQRHPWIGPRRFGGERAIPVCSPLAPLFSGRVAFLGDSACQVFPAHGSGIGSGLIAARLLADALAAGRGVQGYAADWHRRYGVLHATFDVMRRLSQTFSGDTLARLMRHGLIDEVSAEAGLDQRFPSLSLPRLRQFLRGAREVPDLARPLVRAALRTPLLRAHQLLYPARFPGLAPWWWGRQRRLLQWEVSPSSGPS